MGRILDIDYLTHIREPNSWTADQWLDREAWALELSRKMIDEVADAARKAIDVGRGYRNIRRDNFQIPKTSALI